MTWDNDGRRGIIPAFMQLFLLVAAYACGAGAACPVRHI
jgi:hypothetical protein